eukprot:TRINITY_DN3662_c0_g1_i2.p1 TRINITY_DN3662_c0_g1~~TRINITY_DN3662_c0_g1_i2.p1  ORF type:complete len:184 (+),score=12.00 TRINITY_DN3662_c0_g1_i2:128-679(+)
MSYNSHVFHVPGDSSIIDQLYPAVYNEPVKLLQERREHINSFFNIKAPKLPRLDSTVANKLSYLTKGTPSNGNYLKGGSPLSTHDIMRIQKKSITQNIFSPLPFTEPDAESNLLQSKVVLPLLKPLVNPSPLRNQDISKPSNEVSSLNNQSIKDKEIDQSKLCLLYTSPSPRDRQKSRMPSSA